MRRKNTSIFGLALALLLVVLLIVYAASSHRVNNGATELVNEHGVAKYVTNNCGKDIFVPTFTSNEWSLFRSNAPSCVTFLNPPPSCSANDGFVDGNGWCHSNQNDCDEDGLGYVSSWISARASAGMTDCNSEKICANCCGDGSRWDLFYARCTDNFIP